MSLSHRLSWMGLKSWQAGHRTWRRDQRDKRVRPTLTLLEERTLLSQPGTWAVVAPLPTARDYLGAATGTNGTIYAVGGFQGDTPSSEVDAYNPTTNAWTTVAPLPTARGALAVVADNGLIYAIGGSSNIGGSSLGPNAISEVDAYNPATNTWSTVAPLPTARGDIYFFPDDPQYRGLWLTRCWMHPSRGKYGFTLRDSR